MNKLTYALLLIFQLFFPACFPDNPEDKAQFIVDRAIEAHGGEKFNDFRVTFRFRDINYIGDRKAGLYSYERMMEREEGKIHDVLNNEGFTRTINEQVVQLVDTMAAKYTRSVNSVLYFALLPYGLNDSAVIKEYLGQAEINGKKYHEIKVTFIQEGGGEDYQDVFIYWFDIENYYMDYFAYTYETDGGGKRFRSVKNRHHVGGILFQDYTNYEPLKEAADTSIEQYDSLYLNGGLKVLSEIEMINLKSER